jgi:hypothetical protein
MLLCSFTDDLLDQVVDLSGLLLLFPPAPSQASNDEEHQQRTWG